MVSIGNKYKTRGSSSENGKHWTTYVQNGIKFWNVRRSKYEGELVLSMQKHVLLTSIIKESERPLSCFEKSTKRPLARIGREECVHKMRHNICRHPPCCCTLPLTMGSLLAISALSPWNLFSSTQYIVSGFLALVMQVIFLFLAW